MSDTAQAIRLLYGHSIAKELLHMKTSSLPNDEGNSDTETDDPEAWSAESHFTNANYQGKRMVLLLFINRAWKHLDESFMFNSQSRPLGGVVSHQEISRGSI